MAHDPRDAARRCSRFLSDTSGNFATMTALAMPVAIAFAAFAVDQGSLYNQRRQAQGLADLAAIAAAANIQDAEAAVAATLRDNGLTAFKIKDRIGTTAAEFPTNDLAVVSVIRGYFKSDSGVSAELRFTPGITPFNGVRVSLSTAGTRYFADALTQRPIIGVQAVASATPQAAFSVGSRLARVDGGIVNAILGGLLGTNVSMTLMDYEALIDADVSAFAFLDALATELRITGATYDDVLRSSASIGEVASAMAQIPDLNPRAKAAVRAFGNTTGRSLPLQHLFDLGDLGRLAVGEPPAGLVASVSLMDLMASSVALANGRHQVQVKLGAAVPGIADAKLDLAIGEPAQTSPWFAIGETGQVVRTAQTRALLTITLGGPGGLLGTSINLPVYLELAFAEASLSEIACDRGKADRVKVAARPGVAALRIASINAGSLADFGTQPVISPALLVKAPLVTVNGQSLVEMSNTGFTTLSFDRQDIAKRRIKTVSTRDFTKSLTQSLLGNLKLDVNAAGLGLGVPTTLQSTLLKTLGSAAPAVDDLLYSVLTALGVRLGEADVRVVGSMCGRSVLVQ